VLRGEPGWVLPLSDSRDTAAVIDAALASAAKDARPVSPNGRQHPMTEGA
jgi:hypothetical protein